MKPKSIFKSKSAIAATLVFIAGSIGSFSPEASEWLKSNSNVLLMGVGVVQFLIRKVTHEKVVFYGDGSDS